MVTQKYYLHMFRKSLIKSLLASCLTIGLMASEIPQSIVDTVQAFKPNKSLIPSYEIDQIPVESGDYFQAVAYGYNARVKRDVITQLRQSISQGNTNSKEALYLFEQLTVTKTIKQTMALLTRAISAHQIMIAQNMGHQDVIDRNDRVYAAILLQSCVVLTNSARDQLLTILDEINNSLIYWRDQKNHPTKYFFHKSPLKWIMGKNQIKEVSDNIKKLEKLEHNIRHVLGKMIKHLYEFNPSNSVDGTYEWIEQLLSIISCIGTYDDKIEHDTHFGRLAKKIRFNISHVGNLKNVMLAKVASAAKPSHLVRNWMVYTAAIAAGYQAYSFYTNPMRYSIESRDGLREMTNAEWITDLVGLEALKGYGAGIQEYIQENAIKPIKNIFIGASRGGGSDFQESDVKLTREEMKELLDRLVEGEKSWLNIQRARKNSDDSNDEKPIFEWYTSGQFGGYPLTADRMDVIIEAEKNGNITPFLQLLYDMDKRVIGNLIKRDDLIQAALIYSRLLLYHGIQHGIEQGINPLVDELRVTKNLAILAPTLLASVGVGLGLNKMYKWFIARDYSSVRLALIAINSLFIEAHAPLSDTDYGKLIYLLQGLKVKAMRYLPTQNNMRDDFLTDIAKLESQQFTVETKRRIIKNMFNKYPFLSLKEKTA